MKGKHCRRFDFQITLPGPRKRLTDKGHPAAGTCWLLKCFFFSPERVPHQPFPALFFFFPPPARFMPVYSAMPSSTSTLAHASSTVFSSPGRESCVRCRYLIFAMQYGGFYPALLSGLAALAGTVIHTGNDGHRSGTATLPVDPALGADGHAVGLPHRDQFNTCWRYAVMCRG